MDNVEHAKLINIMMRKQSVVNQDVARTSYLMLESEDVFVLAVFTGQMEDVENVTNTKCIYQDKKDVL